ncbi:MAG: DUF488 domain-containing protein [Verrucomicrobia bacterium]|nr:DUF488 domain-containing protein [Prolixibacteraceae bacterium]
MAKQPLYTIGHGNRKPEDFLLLLKNFDIEYLIDVRSQPYSKFNPSFNTKDLKHFLEQNGIRYVFMGDSIGGRPADRSCYDKEGKVNYEEMKTKAFFLEGIERLKAAYQKELNMVIMCSESKPGECHRTKLIGRVLSSENIMLQHIDEHGKLKDQSTVINELNKGLSDIDLFGNSINVTSRKPYL